MSPARILLAIITSSLFILTTSTLQQPQLSPKLTIPGQRLTKTKVQTSKKNVGVSLSGQFLTAHNYFRIRSGARPLKWNKKLALYARRWAKRRMSDCKLIHSYGPYGENIFWGGRDHWTPIQIVDKWVEEYKYFNPKKNECQPGQMCGHYTQILWRDTVRVGCGLVKCSSGGLYAVCTYDPPGNFENEGPFGGVATPEDTNMTPPLLPPPPMI